MCHLKSVRIIRNKKCYIFIYYICVSMYIHMCVCISLKRGVILPAPCHQEGHCSPCMLMSLCSHRDSRAALGLCSTHTTMLLWTSDFISLSLSFLVPQMERSNRKSEEKMYQMYNFVLLPSAACCTLLPSSVVHSYLSLSLSCSIYFKGPWNNMLLFSGPFLPHPQHIHILDRDVKMVWRYLKLPLSLMVCDEEELTP